MRSKRSLIILAIVLVGALAAPGTAAGPERAEYPTEKFVVDGELNPPDSPNPYLAFLAPGQRADYASWTAYLNAAGKVRASREAPGAPRRGIKVREVEGSAIGENDTQADAEFIDGFGTENGERPAAEIAGSAPEFEGDTLSAAAGEPNGSLGDANVVPLEVGDVATGSGVIGDEAAPMGPPDFDFFLIPGVSAGDTIIVDIDTPDPFGDLDPFVAIWNPALAPFEIAANDDDGSSFDSFLSFDAPVDGDYYVSVGGFGAFVPVDPTDPASPSVTGETGSEGDYDITLELRRGNIDFYAFEAEAGDIVGATVFDAATRLELYAGDGTLLMGSGQDATPIHPAVSPLPGGGNASLSFVLEEAGTYALSVSAVGEYLVDLRVFRPAKELTGRAVQKLYLDFDGASLDPGIFFGLETGIEAQLSPLSAFLSRWGLTAADEDAVIDAIVASVEESLGTDPAVFGSNGSLDAGDGGGSFHVEILNSRDHGDLWGQPYVSRVIVGGTIPELQIPTVGIAQSIDVGDFESEETAVVLLDLMSGIPSDDLFVPEVSLNTYPTDPSSSMIELIGTAVGNIVAHEAGHFSANWHTDQFNPFPNIMDQGGNFPGTIGVGPDGIFGSADDIDVDFGEDFFVPNEGFVGLEDTLESIAFGMSTGRQAR